MIIAGFLLWNQLEKVQFFERTFLLTNINIKIVLGMFFLIFSNISIRFTKKDFVWDSYTTIEIISTINKIKLIDKWEFAAMVLDTNIEIFIVYVAIMEVMIIYSTWKTQISLLQFD